MKHNLKYQAAAGRIIRQIFSLLKGKRILAFKNKKQLDRFIETTIITLGGVAACKGYHGFPSAACISVNEELAHAPANDYEFEEGDILTVDIVVGVPDEDGVLWHADAARTYLYSKNPRKYPEEVYLIWAAEHAFKAGVSKVKSGIHTSVIGSAIEKAVAMTGMANVEHYMGHAIGKGIHEAPYIFNYLEYGKQEYQGFLSEGDIICIEPLLIDSYTSETVIGDDGLTILGTGISSHYENTVLVTKDGFKILT